MKVSEDMPKSALEKQIERQMKQEKQLADRKRREDDKRAKDQQRQARKAAIQGQATSIVNGQPLIEGLRIMDATAEETLKCLLNCENRKGHHVNYEWNTFPQYVQMSIDIELEKLVQYGMVGNMLDWMGGGTLDLLPPALSYFDNKEKAFALQKKHEEETKMRNITNYGNLIFGNVSDSTLTVDNSIYQIEQAIDEKGGKDKEELHELLNEVKELIENIEASRSIPKQKKLYQRISDHMEKHGWFYGAVVQLLGTAALDLLGG